MPFESFFMMDVPVMLKKLKGDENPEWGSMTVTDMLDHLRKGIDLSLLQLETRVVTPPELLPRYRDFLMSEKPFKPGAPKPAEFDKIQALEGDVEKLKVNLMKSLVSMMVHFEKHPDHTAVHANFGELNAEEWMHLHRKHILHHFTQFRLT